MRRTALVVLGTFLYCAPPAAAQGVGPTAVNPATVPVGVGTPVLVTATIGDPAVIASSVQLQRYDSQGRVVAVLGALNDAGRDGDAAAGDSIFSIRLIVYELAPGPISLRVSAAFQGRILRVLSAPFAVTVAGTASTISITSPPNLDFRNVSPIVVNGTLGDPAAQVMVNGVAATVTGNGYTAQVPILEGTNTLTAVATNSNGTVTTASVQVTLDTTPPKLAINAPDAGATTTAASVAVSGLVNDIVVGTVNPLQATVTVNGAAAEVSNRSFLRSGVPLALGPNTIQVVATDRSGNSATESVVVTRVSEAGAVSIVSGNSQTGAVGTVLPQPLVVRLTNALGQPVAGVPVVFRVDENSGGLVSGTANLGSLAVQTNDTGQASATFRLGTRSGVGNNIVEATATGFTGPAVFTHSATPTAAQRIVVDTGNSQIGAVGQPLPLPFVAIVTDAGFNRIGGVPVTFTVRQGGGTLGGLATLTTTSDSDGRVAAVLTLGRQEGQDNNVVEATFAGNPGQPAAFLASSKVPADPSQTRITGVVLDNANRPIPGVTMRLFRTHQSTGVPESVVEPVQTGANGQFAIQPAPVGTFKLMADGATAPNGPWPTLEFDVVTISGRTIDVGLPIYLPALDVDTRLCVSETAGGTLTLPQVPGFALTVAAGSATFPGGSRTGCVSVTPVNGDKVPMAPGFGQQPRFVVTIQPVGTVFNPPARLTLPNVDGLAPRQVTEMYSFDHDLAAFVSIGTGTVSEDGSVITSDPGVGVIKAGWHCGGDPQTVGSAGSCPTCQRCQGTQCVADPAKNGVNCTQPSGQPGVCDNGNCGPVQVQFMVNNTAATTDDLTALNNAQPLPITVTLTQGPTTAVSLSLQISPARGTVSPATVSLARGQSTVVTFTPTTQSAAANDAQIQATFSGTQVGSANFTVVNITLPANVRASNTPAGMPDRIPPRVDSAFQVQIAPTLGAGQNVTLVRVGNSASNGDFSINGANTLTMTTTANVNLRGTTQTAATGGAGGGNAGNLLLGAEVRGTRVAQTPGFSVAAIPQDWTQSLVGPVTAPGTLGFIVQDGWSSDSGVLADLDAVDISESVDVTTATGPFSGLGGSTSGYLPATSFTQDTHSTPATVLAGPAGVRIAQQTSIFRDRRTGVNDIPMRNTGYTVTRTVFFESPTGIFRMTTEKVGAATTANGFASGAGAVTGTLRVTQP